jgi:hypothetical protein
MSEVNYDWVRKQMDLAKVKIGAGTIVLELLKAWDGIPEAKPETIAEALDIFTKLAQGHALMEPFKDEIWVAVIPGQIKVADLVRVKHNAFTGEAGQLHNGRRGVIVALRSGDVIFRSNDNVEPLLDGVHYSPYVLEKRVK